ncbi:beta-N-acetylhexosaminidase [uncultured Alistipes sp.]|uniref:beta-N-acetylhexosaminidase n=1 Tax=uncultured Alistipes sp. TaxID=538949 RepID=UPI00280383DC|nr:beta-N-acetylhexosaminidase [uncultured Alistipes sp.]
MKRLLATLCAALFGALSTLTAQPAAGHRTPLSGSFVFGPRTAVAADPGLGAQARYLAEYLGCGIRNDVTADGVVVLTLDSTREVPADGVEAEAYRLEITPGHIRIDGATPGGVFNGIQALLRLLPAEVYAREGVAAGSRVACCRIEDRPRFAYRGMMLDVARTWIDPDGVRRYIDLLAFHSINKLHLHLSDDEGWRIEIRSHPELTDVGAYRGGDSPVAAVYGKWSEKYGGYFKQEEMRELIRYAADRNIEIIPEIDLPGHSRDIASVHPEIRCNYPPDTVATVGYDYRSAWCVAREENYRLLEDILGEICELFPSEYVHVGGDEVDMTQWKSCPDCQALMRQRGMTDPHQLEDLFMERMAEILARHGKRPAVWNEAVRTGDFTRDSRVYGWENVKACLDATAKGYPTVVMPGAWFYFDMRQSPLEDGHDWAAVFDAGKVYGFDLTEAGFSAEQQRNVVGLAGAFWSEIYVSHNPEKPDYLDYMCFPRICALSRLAWSGNAEGWEAYYRELRELHYDRMAAMGIRFRLFPPKLVSRRLANGRSELRVTAEDPREEIFFRVDGSDEEYRYEGPLTTDQPWAYCFYTRYRSGRSPRVADESRRKTLRPDFVLESSMGESRQFPYRNVTTYRGMSRTARACRQQDWIRYTFSEPVVCREMFLQTGYRQLPKTILTTGYAEISGDGIHFERVGELEMGGITIRPDGPVKAVRIVSTCDGNGTPYVTIQSPVVYPRL